MITITTKNAPGQLVEKINTLIKNKRITTWDIDDENDYILNIDEYRYKAWMSIDDRIEGNTLFFCIIESRKYALTKEIYAVYHCKFAEMLLEYFGEKADYECGYCDNCIERKKREAASKNSPIQIAKEIQRLLGNGAISRNEIVESLPYPENEVIESLRFLQDEGFITACEDGIHYKNK